MPSYVLGILAQGNCPVLVKGGLFSARGVTFFAWDKSGLAGIRDVVRRGPKESGCSNAKGFLAVALRAVSSLEAADDWLIPPECLDLSADNVWYDPPERRVLFCLAEKEGNKNNDHEDRTSDVFCFLLQLAALDAPEVYPYIEKLSKRAEEERLTFSAIKKELSLRLMGPG